MKELNDQIVEREITSVINQINQLIMNTEEVYGSIYEKLPSIEEELELNFQEMEILLNYFIYQAEDHEIEPHVDEATQLAELLREMKKNFTESVLKMFDETIIRKTLERFLSNTGNQEEPGIDDLMEIIQKIKKHIQDIEVVSINAMIHSSRLGENGKAFGVISRNIKEFSDDMKHQYQNIYTYAEGLEYWNNQFTQEINKLLDVSKDLRVVRLDEFNTLFYEVFESLKTISILLKDANKNLHGSMAPLQDLMVLIQKQDIIKQSLENVIKCLDTLKQGTEQPIENEDRNVYELNMITFQDQVIELTIALVESISEQLHESLSEINETISMIHRNLSDTYEESYELTEFLSGNRGDDRNTVEELFYRVKTFIGSFKNELEIIAKDMIRFKESSATFEDQMQGIEKQIITIKQRVDFLRNVNVLSRIELSRLTNDMASFGDEIEQISRRVIEEVNLNETFIISLKENLDRDLERCLEMLTQNDEMIQKMIKVAAESLQNLEMIEELVIKAIRPTTDTSIRLIKEIDYVEKIINNSNALTDTMSEIKETLHLAQQKIQLEKEQIFERAGVTEWKNNNNALNELFDKLTTYYERIVLNHFSDTELDIGSEAGELVLF